MNMSKRYVTAEVPFVNIGNRRGLTGLQLMQDQALADFVKRFPDSFEYASNMDIALFIEPKTNDATS